MNTPAHVILNLLCLGRQDQQRVLLPIIGGSLLPDIPMFIFYFVEKVILQTPEMTIWNEAYHKIFWQNFIDVFNSIPLILLGLAICYGFKFKVGLLFFASMLLHIFCDLPFHHDDAHRHFLPFTDWRFISPVSYWDPKHYGVIVTILECLLLIFSCIFLWRIYKSKTGRATIVLVGSSYLAYFVYGFYFWINLAQ